MRSTASAAKGLVKRVLGHFGYHIVPLNPIPNPLDQLSLVESLRRLRPHLHPIQTIVDVGASDGRWSVMVQPFFPDAHTLLVDANRVHESALVQYCAARPRTVYALVAAGENDGEIYFDAADPFGGQASLQAGENRVRVPVRSIDSLIAQHRLPPPYFLKLDTHGFEVPIFEGAKQTLAQAELLLVETYNFDIAPECLRFPQMCLYLEARGFRPIGLCEPLFREDGAFWQIDIFFMRTTHSFFATSTYRVS